MDPGKWAITASDVRLTRQLSTASPIPVELGATPVSVEVPLVDAVETKVTITCARREGAGTRPSALPAEFHLVLEDAAGRKLAEARPWPDEQGIASCGLWTAPQPLKAVVRVGDRVMGAAEGVAGVEIRLTVDLD
jgi:hypothetical protein